jgi:hypothetical protein
MRGGLELQLSQRNLLKWTASGHNPPSPAKPHSGHSPLKSLAMLLPLPRRMD